MLRLRTKGGYVCNERAQRCITLVTQEFVIEIYQTPKTDTSGRTHDKDQAYLINSLVEVMFDSS